MAVIAGGLWHVLSDIDTTGSTKLAEGVYALALRMKEGGHDNNREPEYIDSYDDIQMDTGEIYTPAAGYISSRYGYRRLFKRNHYGLDIANSKGTHLYSALGGVVNFVGPMGSYGLLIEINHGNGIMTRYGHCNAIMVRKGERVARGEYIGQMGSTGRSTGPHLHFEIRLDGRPVDPEPFMKIVYK